MIPTNNCTTVVCYLNGTWVPGDQQNFTIKKIFSITDGTNNATNPNGTIRFTTDKYVSVTTMHPDINILNFQLYWQSFNGSFDTAQGQCYNCSYDLDNLTCQAEVEKVFGMFQNYNLSLTLTTANPVNMSSLNMICRTANDTAQINPNCNSLFSPYGAGVSGCVNWTAVPGRSALLPGGKGVAVSLTNLTNLTVPIGVISPSQNCKIVACEINGTWSPGQTQSFVLNKTFTAVAI
jgi:hypothetical protein